MKSSILIGSCTCSNIYFYYAVIETCKGEVIKFIGFHFVGL
jgi:hypothetical protein